MTGSAGPVRYYKGLAVSPSDGGVALIYLSAFFLTSSGYAALVVARVNLITGT